MDTSTLSVGRHNVTISPMAKRGRTGGDHKTPRQAVQVPLPWLQLARKLAGKKKQPTLWFLLALLADAADSEGEEHPALPWEEGGEII